MRKIFRSYTVLLVSNRLTEGVHQALLEPFGFGRVETVNDDYKALSLAKKLKPHLIVAGRSLSVFTGAQLLSAAREDANLKETPFLVIGDREDLKSGGLAGQVQRYNAARFAGLPMKQEEFNQLLVDLLDPFIDPDHERAFSLFDQAEKLIEKGKRKAAAPLLKEGLELYDEYPSAWLNYGVIMTEMENADEAEEAYFRALNLNRYSLMAYIGLTDLYERLEDYDQAIGVLKQAVGVAKLMKVSAKSVARINYFIGEFELRLQRLTGAEKAFDQAVASDPADAELRTDIGDAYARQELWEASEKHYQAAIDIDPNLAHVFNRLGIAYRRQGKYQKALELYDQALLHHPEDEHLLFNIARAQYEASRQDDAEATLEAALVMAPEFEQAGYLMKKIRKAMFLDLASGGERPDENIDDAPVQERVDLWDPE
jgi:tetratricopeptide (TPR) repeat protein